jgi:hypothetical protein
MRSYLRWAVGGLVGLWTVRGEFFLALTAAAKAGLIPMVGDAAAWKPLVDALTAWQLILWGAAYAAFAVALVRLALGRTALLPLVVAVAMDVTLYLTLHAMPAYRADPATERLDQLGLAALLGVTLLLWRLERAPPPATTAA